MMKAPAPAEQVRKLAEELKVDNILANLMIQRGISSYEEARKFFRPEPADLHDPFLMKDMDKAVDRIISGIHDGEKILVYGDYDVDGTTAVALVYSFFRKIYPHVDFYIPDRYREGYGISSEGIDWAKANGFSLVVALDCGIKAVDKIAYARGAGIDFIVCDHHMPGTELPAAAAILDPKQHDCSYPYKELSGCGIGYKLVQAFCLQQGMEASVTEQYLDLVALSIAADIVPVTGENRVLVHSGLQKINREPRPGIGVLLELAGAKKQVNVSDLVFMVAPRINAAGRLENARQAVELLLAENYDEALPHGKALHSINAERKSLDAATVEHALRLIEKEEGFHSRKTTVVYHPEWHKGVVGIVAARLTEHFYRPTIVFTRSGNLVTGSARSVRNFDIHQAIETCAGLLEQFGGHKYAAGITLREENIDAFRRMFEEVVSASIREDMLVRTIEIDAEIQLSDITPRFYSVLRQFAPFGPGNMAPVFLSRNVQDKGWAKVVGNDHLKMNLSQAGVPGKFFDAIAFRQAGKLPVAESKVPFDICYSVEENEWNGSVSLQLNIKDILPGG